jgi:KaiC/GvpD/RAD55 family RecA-like ATPase
VAEQFIESHVRMLYRLLGHGNEYTDLRCIDVNLGKVVSREIVKGEAAVVEWAKAFNGKGNCFVGRNPRKDDGSVSRVTTVSFDIDPVRPKGQASSDAGHSAAIHSARSVLQVYTGGYISSSGNGSLVIYRLPQTLEVGTCEQAIKSLEDELRKLLTSEVKLDATYDSARLVKLLGTISTKGARSEWRTSRFLELPIAPYRLGSSVYSRIQALREGVKQETSETVSVASSVYPSRSEADYALAVHYKKAGLSKEAALEALSKHAIGRNNRKDDHIRIVAKVFTDEPGKGVEAQIQPLLGYYTPNGNLEEHKARLRKRSEYSEPELPTGFKIIDKHTWGLRRGEILTIAARTGIGKTSVSIDIATKLLRRGKRVLFFTTEMSVESIIDRFLQNISGIEGDKFSTGRFEDADQQALDAAYKQMEGYKDKLFICDATSPNIHKVVELTKELKPDVLIFDHIQHISGKYDSARYNVSEFVRGLKDVSRETQCAVLALSQVRRLFKDAKTQKEIAPALSDLKESGTIEEESGAVIILSVLDEVQESNTVNVLADLCKNRYGSIEKVGLEFNRKTARFKDLEAL